MRNSEIETVVIESNALQNLADVNYQLHSATNSLNELQLDCNRNRHHYLLCEKIIEAVHIANKLCNATDLTLPIKIALEVNRLFSTDKNLSTVCIKIENSKRILNLDAIAHLKIKL